MSKTNIKISLKDDVSRKAYHRQYYLLRKTNQHKPTLKKILNDEDASKTYYQRNRDIVLEKMRTDEFKQKRKEYNKSYYLKNKEALDKRSANRNNTNKELLTIEIMCKECQISIKKYGVSKHIKTENHKFNIEFPEHKYSKTICYECHSFYENKTTHQKSKKHISAVLNILKEQNELKNSEI